MTNRRTTAIDVEVKQENRLLRLPRVVLAAALGFGLGQPVTAQAPGSVLGVECSQIGALGIDKQMNMRAAMIRVGCGVEAAGNAEGTAQGGRSGAQDAPLNVNTITEEEVFPKVTQSEAMVWSSDGATIVVTMNDSSGWRPSLGGVSVSQDGGETFTRLLPSPFATGHGENYGDPVVVYNAALQTWFAGFMAQGCGGQGLGLWTSPNGVDWKAGACAHRGTFDDRESMWVDNNPDSPYYGRMYISWNNFSAGQRIFVTHSDDGVDWSAPAQLSSGFIRNIQLTGGPDGTVFVAGMNEGGGGFNNRTNIMYKSTDGGDTWAEIIMGPPFAPPGDSTCGFFARINPIWRHMGWGQPAAGPDGVIHYPYAGRGVNEGDRGDILYTRSVDNGETWSEPIILNTDQAQGGDKSQWMPSVSVSSSGKVLVSWYDRRNTSDGRDYEVWGIESPDNGATWGEDFPISDILIPQPAQPDPLIQACYCGDYNYNTAFDETSYVVWTDGRNLVNGVYQQDVYFAKVAPGASIGRAVSVSGRTAGRDKARR